MNGEFYLKKVLQKVIPEVRKREDDGEMIDQKVHFDDFDDMIFEQEYAKPHSTKVAYQWLTENVPNFTAVETTNFVCLPS